MVYLGAPHSIRRSKRIVSGTAFEKFFASNRREVVVMAEILAGFALVHPVNANHSI
jgi:hypothetical protein